MTNRDVVNAGEVLVYSLDRYIGFDPGDEYRPCVWVSGGTIIDSVQEHDDCGFATKSRNVANFNPIDIISGVTSDWGSHMFMRVSQFMREYKRINYMMNDPVYAAKVNFDLEVDCLHKTQDIEIMQMINAIIDRVHLSDNLGISDEAMEYVDQYTLNTLKEIGALKKFDIPTPSEIQMRDYRKHGEDSSSDVSGDNDD